MNKIFVSVVTPNREFEYTTLTAPRKGEDICIEHNIYTVQDVAHILCNWIDGADEITTLDYILVRAE